MMLIHLLFIIFMNLLLIKHINLNYKLRVKLIYYFNIMINKIILILD